MSQTSFLSFTSLLHMRGPILKIRFLSFFLRTSSSECVSPSFSISYTKSILLYNQYLTRIILYHEFQRQEIVIILGKKERWKLKESHFGIRNVDSKLVNGGFWYYPDHSCLCLVFLGSIIVISVNYAFWVSQFFKTTSLFAFYIYGCCCSETVSIIQNPLSSILQFIFFIHIYTYILNSSLRWLENERYRKHIGTYLKLLL